MSAKYVLGLDYGTESGRALLVAVKDGREVATAVAAYPHGVIDAALSGTGQKLPRDWALQHPGDYLTVTREVVARVLAESGADAADIIGIGTDFTACTLLPVDASGTPLCLKPEWSANPHAWVKLWKHHGAQAQADKMNAVARERGEAFLKTYGGTISSEWLFPKALDVLENAPEVYAAADMFIEAADWIVLQLTGALTRNACCAGYKATYDDGYPSREFLAALNPAFENVVAEKLRGDIFPMGARAGGLSEAMARELGLTQGIAVAVGGIDAHISVPPAAVSGAGKMVLIMGTSLCHMVCGTEKKVIEGMSGVVKDGILPGLYGYEAGQAAVGDLFAWFVDNCVPKKYYDAAEEAGLNIHQYLIQEADKLKVGESGVICLDWWNGNRSILADATLSGMMVGMTLNTTPAELYRALLESTAFGTLTIIRQLESGGCPIDELYACGGMPGKNPLLMQIFADVCGREIKIAESQQTGALGAAMWGAVAAGAAQGGYDSIEEAVQNMARLRPECFTPDASRHEQYQVLFAEFEKLHDYFGRGGNPVMKTLRKIRHGAI